MNRRKQSQGIQKNEAKKKRMKKGGRRDRNIDLYKVVLVYTSLKKILNICTFFTNHTPRCQIYFHTTPQLLEFECNNDLQN